LNEGIQQLVGFNPPSGASWSGTGIVDTANGVFNPETSGVGTFTITIQNGQGTCFTSDTRSITVRPLPALSITPDQTVCGNAVPFAQSNFTPASGGIWEGTGITDANTGMFDPSLGSGTYNLLFRYTDPTILCSDTAYKTITVSPVPVANFSVAPLGCTNSPVVLNNTSTGATTYNWNFGNGYATAGFSPVYTYPAEGIFDIQLIASNGFGCRDTASNTNEIINPPLAVLGVSPTEGCAPLPVSFSNSSVGQYLSYFWDLTITTTTDTIPQDLVYQQGQVDIVYPISLTATNFCGSSTDNESITVHPQPVAGFGTDLDVFCSPFTVNFNDISVGNPDTWEWNFNDGSPNVFASEPVSHTFFADSIPVDYTIWLYLANECGRDTASYTITVLPNTVTSFFNTNVTSGCSPLTVEFTDYSDGADQIYYNLGDQTTDGNDNPVHTYSIPGEYCIYQYADNGCSYDTSFICIEVFASPTVDFTQEDLSVCAAEQIQFHSQVTNAVEMEWDFGDDTTSQNSDPYHTYAQGGTYNVLLTAVSDNGCTMSRTRPISVYDSPSASISVPDQIGCSPFSICFSNASTGGNFYSWDFGDGNTSGVSAPCHTFINDGVGAQLHTVRMISQNVHLCADTVYMDIVVSPQPTSAFTLSSFESCYAPQTITATNFSINANSYEWFLDNQSISTTTSGQFIIPEVGDYAIRLEASNQFGCTGSSTAVYSIHPLPIIEASATPDEGCVDLAVQFDNLTSGGTDYQWYFGDGASSTEISPSHTYTIPGAYQVQLIATTNQGCVDTLLYEPLIKAYNLPVANFIATPDIVNVYNPIFRFTDTSFDSHRWEWNFGDGGSANIPVVSHLYRAAGTFPVTLTVWNEHNCKSEITKNFTVEDIFNVWVPNTFTPDRDGINEVFLPQVSGIPFVEFYNFQVIDRWGVTIFETSDPTEPWLGNVRDGEYYGSVDSYTWQIKVILKGSDEERLYYGHVNLVR
jgi:PKD repeat protein